MPAAAATTALPGQTLRIDADACVVGSDGTQTDVRLAPTSLLAVDGVIVAVGAPAEIDADPRAVDAVRLSWRDKAMLPGTVNTHNHSFQSLLRGIGDDLPFLQWRDRALYRFSPGLSARDIETGALLAFGEMLLHGVTSVCDFFYINGGDNERVDAVLRAAQRLGIRAVLARCFYDWDGAPAIYRETIGAAADNARALHKQWHDNERLRTQVHVAPHSLHGASQGMIEMGSAVAGELGVPWHIHLAEESYQVDAAVARYGQRPMHAVAAMNVDVARMIAVHACWFDEGERELLAARGGSLAYCPGSNMFLGDGITNIPHLLRLRVPVGLGTDGGCSNNRVSVFDEMRMCGLLQKVAATDGQAMTAEQCLALGTRRAANVLRLPVGLLTPGMRCDVVAVDLGDPSLWPAQALAKNVVYALASRAITDVVVDGDVVVRDRALVNVDLAEIRARVSELTATWQP
ncbi:MAG: amidohydrolase family protein [Myxococcales bacterium]|nr:amidohydrolase family protein [Myxococcales bacterium]